MNLEKAKENLFKMKPLSYLEAIESKMELIRNKEFLEMNISLDNIKIIQFKNNFYLKYTIEEIDNKIIARAEKGN